jgi:hypothetical protein
MLYNVLESDENVLFQMYFVYFKLFRSDYVTLQTHDHPFSHFHYRSDESFGWLLFRERTEITLSLYFLLYFHTVALLPSSLTNQFKLANPFRTPAKVPTVLGKYQKAIKTYCTLFVSFYVQTASSTLLKHCIAHKRQSVTSWKSGVKVHVTTTRGRTSEYWTKPRGINGGALFSVAKMFFLKIKEKSREIMVY